MSMFAGGPFERFLQRVSAGYHDWLDLREALDIEPFYSPVAAFVLFNRRQQHIDRALGYLGSTAVCSELTSPRPIHDGYVTVLELTDSKQGEDVVGRARAFIEREAARDAEEYLRERYGTDRQDDHEVFRFMDHPWFDNGTAAIGFGLMTENRGPRRWLWSRIAFAHK